MIYWQLFQVFTKIGLLGFGGGYAMLSLIQFEVVDHYGWLTTNEFADIVALSQMTPGPIGINSATYVGYQATGSVWGAALATFAVVLPSFILLFIVIKLLQKWKENPYIKSIFTSLRPIVVGLVASALLQLTTPQNFIDYYSVLLAVAAFVAVQWGKIHPIVAIVLGGVCGYFLYI